MPFKISPPPGVLVSNMPASSSHKNSSAPIVWTVHAGLLAVLLIGGLIPSCRHKKMELTRVNLVELPPSQQAPTPTPPTPTPPTPTPPTPTPKPKPRHRLRTPEEIRRSANLLKPPSKFTPPNPKPISSQSIANTLTQSVQKVQIRYKAPRVGAVSAAAANRYLSTFSAILRGRWNQPSAAELGGRHPVTAVALTIARDGRVTTAKISRGSGNAAMDLSVQTLLNGLTRLPPPSQYGIDDATFSVDIAFETM